MDENQWEDRPFQETVERWIIYMGQKYSKLNTVKVYRDESPRVAIPFSMSFLENSFVQAIPKWKNIQEYNIQFAL